jgi:hypothetical protein
MDISPPSPSLSAIQSALKTADLAEDSLNRQLSVDRKSVCDSFDQLLVHRKRCFAIHAFLADPNFSFNPSILRLFLSNELPVTDSSDSRFLTALSALHRPAPIAAAVHSLSLRFPESLHELTFSFVPSLFLLFATASDQHRFCLFLSELLALSADLGFQIARAAFVLPEFIRFLKFLDCHQFRRFSRITSTASFVGFFETFLRLAAEFSAFIPPLIRELASLPDSAAVFERAFFGELFSAPARFGLAVLTEASPVDLSVLADPSFPLAVRFCEIARRANAGSVTPFEAAFERVPVFGRSFILTGGDLGMLLGVPEKWGDLGFVRLRPTSASVSQSGSVSLLDKLLLSGELISEERERERESESERESGILSLEFLKRNLVEPLPSYEAARGRFRLALLSAKFPAGVPIPPSDFQSPESREAFSKLKIEVLREQKAHADHAEWLRWLGQLAGLTLCLGGESVEGLAQLESFWKAECESRKWRWWLARPVAIVKLWEGNLYSEFAKEDPVLLEMDEAVASALEGLELLSGEEGRELRSLLDNFEDRGSQLRGWTTLLFEADNLYVAVHMAVRLFEAAAAAMPGECTPDDRITLLTVALSEVRPPRWLSRIVWIDTIGMPLCEGSGDPLMSSTFPQAILPFGHVIGLLLGRSPSLSAYGRRYPSLAPSGVISTE